MRTGAGGRGPSSCAESVAVPGCEPASPAAGAEADEGPDGQNRQATSTAPAKTARTIQIGRRIWLEL